MIEGSHMGILAPGFSGWLTIPVNLSQRQLRTVLRAYRRGGWRWRLVSTWYGVKFVPVKSGESSNEGEQQP